ncbi:MAG: class I SAM-dependent methyltransferase [Dehalococcoidia bacterium]|nr:class I SAM-dependent methyltransferase [Dehalococcoidia bacterium]MDD5493731.1 class I SAM-dependent methyltransferase [Dehalococcoidia bacterium]
MKVCQHCGQKFDLPDWKCTACGYEPTYQNGFVCLGQLPDSSEPRVHVEDFKELVGIDEANFWFRSRNRLLIWTLAKYFPNNTSFLEIGCGPGYVLNGIKTQFPQLKVKGSDIYTESLVLAAKRVPDTELFQMDATYVPFADEFGVVGAFDVIEHIKDDEKTLTEIHRAVKPGGGIIVTVPQHPFMWSNTDVYACHVRRYTKRELKTKMEKSGFRIVRMTSFVTFPFPIMLVSRLLNRKPKDNYDPMREFKISKSANSLLEAVLDIERLFIKTGISFPFGGSLLAVAKKE